MSTHNKDTHQQTVDHQDDHLDQDLDDQDDHLDDQDDHLDQDLDRGLTKPAITRLARRAGVKSMSDECIGPIRNIIAMKLDELITSTIIVNGQHTTKTIMDDHIYQALSFMNINVARTEEF